MAATVSTVAYLGLEARAVEVQVQLSAGLPAGDYRATVRLTAPGAARDLTLRLVVSERIERRYLPQVGR